MQVKTTAEGLTKNSRLAPAGRTTKLCFPPVSISMNDIHSLKLALRDFAAERDWAQFHSPKNLAAALTVEAAELLEHFQWLTEDQSRSLSAEMRDEIADEIADVMLYLIQIADKLDVDLLNAAADKLARNAKRYPIDRSRGSSKKYNELGPAVPED
jgi:dCTP diphosphatase